MTNLRIYVGTYRKYNEGSIYGAWLDLDNYADFEELMEAMRTLHKDETDPEFMFQDYECSNIFEHLDLIGEHFISDEIYSVIEAIENSHYDERIIEAYVDSTSSAANDIQEILTKIEGGYMGEFESDIEFAKYLIEGSSDVLNDLPSYISIDWERTAYTLMMDYTSDNNFYFRIM